MPNKAIHPQAIGILGGTFDPVHLGHLQFAHEAYERLPFKEIRFVPAYQTVHRAQPSASVSDRLAMLKLALQNQTGMSIDTREIQRQGPSYMIDTLQSIRQEIADTPLCLLMATDAFANFNRWQQWQMIPEYTHLVIVERPHQHQEFNQEIKNLLQARQVDTSTQLLTKSAGNILFLSAPCLAISSTQIRQLIAQGESAETFLPENVWEYIQTHQLYQNPA